MAAPPPALVPVDAALAAAAAALPVGGLLHGPLFSLHDAMLAVELGDPKLDAGARGRGGEPAPPPAPPTAAPAPAVAAAALDDLAAQEAAWHAGGSLSTTLLTHPWMLWPESTSPHPLPRAVAAAGRAAAAAATAIVQRGAVAEDEDWQLHPQPIPGDDGGDDAAAGLAAIAAALDAGTATGADLGLASDPTPAERAALSARVAFRAATLACLQAAKDADTAALARGVAQAGQASARVKETAGAVAAATTLDAAAARAVLPPSPPRPDRRMTRDEGLAAWATTLSDLGGVAAFGAAADAAGGGLRGSARALASYGQRRAGAVPRSALALVLGLGLDVTGGVGGDGTGEASDATPTPPTLPPWAPSLASVAADTGLPWPHPPGDMAAKFLEQALLGVQGYCVAALLNRARARRRHRRCLEDWVHVHQHAANAEADPEFGAWLAASGWRWDPPPAPPPGAPPPPDAAVAEHASPLSAWVEEAACRAALAHIGAGWGLDLYLPHEAPALLWHADYLGRRAEGAALALAMRWPAASAAAKKSPKGKTRKPPPPPPPSPQALAIYADAVSHTCRRTVAGALMRAAAALAARGGRGFEPPRDGFNTGAERFAARFASLAALTVPPPLSHGDYVVAVESAIAKHAPLDLLKAAQAACVGAKQTVADLAARTAAGGGSAPRPESEEAALIKVAALTAASLGLLVAEAGAEAAAATDTTPSAPPPRVWTPVWDASVHATLPALRLVRD